MKRLIAASLFLSLVSTPVMAEEITAKAVAQQAINEEQAEQMVRVDKTPIALQSHLKKRYSGYKVTVVNNYPGTLNLTSANIDNGTPGVVAASNTSTSYVNILWGLPFWLLGMGVAALIISGKNNKAETESLQFSNQIPTNSIHKNETVTFNALVPAGQNPSLKLYFQDSKTGLSFTKTSI